MENVIKGIISQIPTGVIFDTHTIIEYLLQNNSDDYLSSFTGGNTKSYHGKIGQIIDSFDGTLLEQVGASWSMNIRKTLVNALVGKNCKQRSTLRVRAWRASFLRRLTYSLHCAAVAAGCNTGARHQ